MSAITRVSGRALPIRGNDIDTDRVMPARFLKAITFDGLERHLFEDDRKAAASRGEVHPLDHEAYRGARVLLANANFGCGSSREHAPQALRRWGLRAIVGPSFAEIFFGNAVMIGLPCVTVADAELEWLRETVTKDATLSVDVDLDTMTVTAGGRTIKASMPPTARHALISGAWDGTGLLLEDYEQVRRVADRLPYVHGFSN
jgi:3-isopropylmalate/(R)-2-methylmalate dehydratase small subunit